MLMPQPKAEEIPDLYKVPSYYTHGEDHIRQVKSRFWDKVLTKLAWKADFQTPFEPNQIARLLPAGGGVCDLGCGHAVILRRFKEMGFRVTGVEPDPSSRELAENYGVTVLPGTAEALPPELAGRQFDLVVKF
jgi:SAM-dependent methyltransferase